MKGKRLLWISAFLLMLAGCSDEVVEGEQDGIVYDINQQIDESAPLSTFFKEELHNPYWDGYGNEFKTFFEEGDPKDESFLVINSLEEFQTDYMGTKELPSVDFNLYTLIIGRTWGSDSAFWIADIILRDKGAYYELETKLYHIVDVFAFQGFKGLFYWRLYPKLAQKPMISKRSVIDVHNSIW